MTGKQRSGEAESNSASLFILDGNTEPSKAGFYCTATNTHTQKEGKKLLYIVKCVCLRTHTHTIRHTHTQSRMWECSAGRGGGYRNREFWDFGQPELQTHT